MTVEEINERVEKYKALAESATKLQKEAKAVEKNRAAEEESLCNMLQDFMFKDERYCCPCCGEKMVLSSGRVNSHWSDYFMVEQRYNCGLRGPIASDRLKALLLWFDMCNKLGGEK